LHSGQELALDGLELLDYTLGHTGMAPFLFFLCGDDDDWRLSMRRQILLCGMCFEGQERRCDDDGISRWDELRE